MENKQFSADENKTVCSKISICTMSSMNSLAILPRLFYKKCCIPSWWWWRCLWLIVEVIMILIIRDMKAQSEKEGPIEFSNLRIIIWQIWRVFANCFFLCLNSTQKWPTFIQKRAKLVLFSILSTKTVINNDFQACRICLTFWEIFKILFEGGSHFHSAVGRGTWQKMIAQVNRKWSCDEDGVHMSTKWLPIPRFLRKNEKLFLKRKI